MLFLITFEKLSLSDVDDWWVKGAHVDIDKIEIAIKPGKYGQIIYKPVFSKTDVNTVAWKNKIKVVDYLEKAKERWPDKAAEWSHLQKALNQNTAIKGITGKGC